MTGLYFFLTRRQRFVDEVTLAASTMGGGILILFNGKSGP